MSDTSVELRRQCCGHKQYVRCVDYCVRERESGAAPQRLVRRHNEWLCSLRTRGRRNSNYQMQARWRGGFCPYTLGQAPASNACQSATVTFANEKSKPVSHACPPPLTSLAVLPSTARSQPMCRRVCCPTGSYHGLLAVAAPPQANTSTVHASPPWILRVARRALSDASQLPYVPPRRALD